MSRKTIFWLHLACGVSAGVVVLMMSVTGVVLTYERQAQVWEDRSYYAEPETGQLMLTADQLIAASRNLEGFEASSLMLNSDPTAPVVLRQGRSRSQTQYLNPYSGQAYNPHSDTWSAFFSTVRGWHRWFNMTGDNRSSARIVTGAANLMFLFLVLSGIYLWLPKIYAQAALRARVWFNASNSNANARNFNWHHVFGFWAALPLVVIISTATVFNYTWANNLVYQLAGEEPPVRGGSASVEAPNPAPVSRLPYADLVDTAKTYSEDWRTITLAIPAAEANSANLTLDEGDGGQPQKRHVLTLDVSGGEVIKWAPFTSQSAGAQARRWVRFLHTGEALGLTGQTIAGIASFAAILMVWTGLALALRRFLRWLTKLRKTREVEVPST
jgi:uncharacterized iron-regulated membrane protein